ncbi:MAG TPA: DUF3098 domain-containing protein [Flavobacteriales bacterium]|jgi:uncharacterized membrane protein YjjP (DUF1212 family)|nr:DUF3098 domain-containing protein [Flavobacteriales bacterium]HIK63178.1 DUF3098 domain-containing protein [Flavobacteriales bacterium]
MNQKNNLDFAFTKQNYILLLVGVALICAGLLLMIGGGSDDPTIFSDKIFDSQRLALAPILIALGFIVEIFAIMHKPKDK